MQQTALSSTLQRHKHTIKQLLKAPKDKNLKLAKSGVIYKYKCPTINCKEEYIGESGRTFGDRYKKHLKAPSPIPLHTSSTGHPVSPECFSVVDREAQGMARNIKEAMYIRVKDPSLNKNLATSCIGANTQGNTYTAPQVTLQPPLITAGSHSLPCIPTTSQP